MVFAGNLLVRESDPFFSNVSLLLLGDGTNNATTIVDSSANPKSMTAVGNAKISTAQSKFGGSSLAFDGNGDYFQTPANTAFDLGSGNFTIEAWVYLNAHPASYAGSFGATIVGQSSQSSYGWFFYVTGSSSQTLTLGLTHATTSQTNISGTANLALNTWYHLAATRSGNTVYLFKDGTIVNGSGTAYSQTLSSSTATVKVGALDFDVTYKYWLNGFIDDLRITKGVARYTSSFTPPTRPFTNR